MRASRPPDRLKCSLDAYGCPHSIAEPLSDTFPDRRTFGDTLESPGSAKQSVVGVPSSDSVQDRRIHGDIFVRGPSVDHKLVDDAALRQEGGQPLVAGERHNRVGVTMVHHIRHRESGEMTSRDAGL